MGMKRMAKLGNITIAFLVLIGTAFCSSAQTTTFYATGPYKLYSDVSSHINPGFPTLHSTIADAIATYDWGVAKEFSEGGYQIELCAYKREQVSKPLVWHGNIDAGNDIVMIYYVSTTAPQTPECPTRIGEIDPNVSLGAYDHLGRESCDAQITCGNPINFAAKNKLQSELDTSQGRLIFERHYNSASGISPSYVGRNWRHSYSKTIDGIFDANLNSGSAILYREDGAKTSFILNNGIWENPNRPHDKLEVLVSPDGSGTVTDWRYSPAGSTQVEHYDAHGRLISVVDVGKGMSITLDYLSELFDGSQDFWRATKVTDENKRSLTIEYGNNGQISKLTTPDGGEYEYFYDAGLHLIGISFPGGTNKEYHYAEPGFVPSWSIHPLTGITDESSSRYAYFYYNSSEVPYKTEHAGGVDRYQIQYSGNGQSVSITGPSGESDVRQISSVLGGYKATSIVRSCIGCVSQTSSYTYNAQGKLETEVDGSGTSTSYTYNSRGLRNRKIEAESDTLGNKRTIQTDWHSDFPIPTERRIYDGSNSLIGKSTYTYNTRGQALTASQIDPVSSVTRTTTMTYCEQADVTAGTCPLVGLVRSVNGPRTDVIDTTSYTYRMADEASCATTPTTCPYRKGDLWKATNALSQVTETLKYDGAGRVLSVKDANGVITDLEYHPRGWLTARKTRGTNNTVETDDAITRIEYWPTGLVKKVTQPDGAFTAYTYDSAHRLTDIADNSGNTIHYTLDNAGNRIKEDTKDPASALKRTLSRVFNQLGHLQIHADAQANPTDFTYDANGNIDTVTDALDRVTDNDYDPLGRLSRTLQNVSGINAETQFAYDAQNNLTQVTDPKGLNTTYTYNGLGDLTQLTSPDTGTTLYTYDSGGNRKTQTDARNETATYSYNALNRLTGIAYATPALNVSYAYDTNQAVCTASTEKFSKGRLTKLTDASGTTQYCYDRFGNLVRKVQTTNGIALTVRYTYTLAGNLKTVTYPDGALVTYTRDAQGRITQATTKPAGTTTNQVVVKQIAYAPFGPAVSWKYGNNRILLRPLNQDYRPTAIHDAGVGGLSVGFQYDPIGNLTQLTPGASAIPQVKLDYDALSRLTAFKDGLTDVAIETYAYDTTGNRQSVTNSAGTKTYTYQTTSHRLSQVGTEARTYDAAGNTTAIGGVAKEFAYDATGRMSQVNAGGVATMNYQYNGKGEQVRKYLGTANTYTVYDEAGHWLGDYDTTGAAVQQAIWLNDLPVGLIANGNIVHYIEPDHLGTPRVVIEVARNLAVWTWDLKGEAFGNSEPNQNPDLDANLFALNMRFPGQRYDAATGLNYNYFRDYDPATGRYSQSDPIGLMAGVSTYGYVSGSPLVWADMYGLLQWTLMPVQWNTGTATGAITRTYPGARQSEFRENTLARTTMDWNISARCTCGAGGYSLDEFEVSLTPIVLLRQRYDSPEIRRSTRRDELDHVRDLNTWANGARTGAEQFENSFKSQSFSSELACLEAARAAMQGHLSSGIVPAVTDSHNRWDAGRNPRHRLIVPGD